MIDYIEQLADSCPDQGTNRRFGPIHDLSILEQAEATLGARFPDQFRDYLIAYAGGSLIGWEIYGFPNERSMHPDGFEIMLDIIGINQLMNNPKGCIEFTQDGGGYFFAFIPEMHGDSVCVRGYGMDWDVLYPDFHTLLERTADGTAVWPRRS